MQSLYGRVLISAVLAAYFCTFSALATAQVAPPLGQAGSFSILAGSAVTNTGPTIVVGDLGVSPGSAISGFPPGNVTGGTLHISDAVALGAQNDVTTAYNILAGEASTADLTGQDLGGMTLVSGVYTFSSSAQLTGMLTLDAQGDPNAVFVFQIGSTLTTASNAQVIIINGGANCNVFWQVGSSATLGTTTTFVGNILALTSITLTTGVNVSGRVLARNGAVTMDSNNVVVCGMCGIITVSPSSLPAAVSGVAYSETLTASGGTGPYSYAVVTGALPAGLSLSPSGLLAGTPTISGSYSFTVRATDSQGCEGQRTYTFIVNAPTCTTVTLLPATLPALVVGVEYGEIVTATGGTAPFTFSVASGTLPAGLVLGAGNGTSAPISGTPTEGGPYTFSITATDAGGCVGIQTYSGTVGINAQSVALPSFSVWSSLLLALFLILSARSFLLGRRG